MLMKAGIPMVICDGRRERVVVDAAEGLPVGTLFAAGRRRWARKKLWIALGRNAAGEVVVDDGAREALMRRNTSLLPAGVVAVVGSFAAGDAVVLKDRSGAVIARGLAEFSSADLDRVKGLKIVADRRGLPEIAGKEVVHRDRLVIL